MANPLNNEKELFERIKAEKITITLPVWNLIYHRVGDDVTAINLICEFYLNKNEQIPASEAKKIEIYALDAGNIINDLCRIKYKQEQEARFPEFEKDIPLHPIIRDMLTHYLGNDTQIINLIVGVHTEPGEEYPLSQKEITDILEHTGSLKQFMDRLQAATCDGAP